MYTERRPLSRLTQGSRPWGSESRRKDFPALFACNCTGFLFSFGSALLSGGGSGGVPGSGENFAGYPREARTSAFCGARCAGPPSSSRDAFFALGGPINLAAREQRRSLRTDRDAPHPPRVAFPPGCARGRLRRLGHPRLPRRARFSARLASAAVRGARRLGRWPRRLRPGGEHHTMSSQTPNWNFYHHDRT